MQYHTGRNDPCPCGSGKKFKKCCLGKVNLQVDPIQHFMSTLSEARKESSSIKLCLHPAKEECFGHIVRAHAIQNNRVLTKLAVDGFVRTMDGVSNIFFQDSQSKGRRIATTFSGFCEYHDKVTFQDIEDFEFIGNQKQIFLLSYRTFAWHYHKKLQQIAREEYFNQQLELNTMERRRYMSNLAHAISDNETKRLFFDRCLLQALYDDLSYCIWEIPYEVKFAVSAMIELDYDILGNPLNNYVLQAPTRSIYLNILPTERKSFCVWSWPKDTDEFYSSFAHQFMSLPRQDKENYLNNQLPLLTDAIIISPRLWSFWGSDIQEALISHANTDVLYDQYKREDPNWAIYRYEFTPWNFFESLAECITS